MKMNFNNCAAMLARVTAIAGIHKLIGKYCAVYPTADETLILPLFAERDDSQIEMPWGVYEGWDSIVRCFTVTHPRHEDIRRRAGELHFQPAMSPVIELASDGLSAKAVWTSPGFASGITGEDKLEGFWSWQDFSAQLVREGDNWKIWRMRVTPIIFNNFYHAWTEGPACAQTETPFSEYFRLTGEGAPDRGPTKLWEYSKSALYSDIHPGLPKHVSGYSPEAPGCARTVEELEYELQRREAEIECKNLQARYAFLHIANKQVETVELFAKKRDDVRSTMVWGVYEGQEGVRENFVVRHMDVNMAPGRCRGLILYHVMLCPVFEVAGDLQTARSVWFSPAMSIWPDVPHGVVTEVNENSTSDTGWGFIKYGMEFVKEDGQWRILHQRVYGVHASEYDKCWTDLPPANHNFVPQSKEELAMYPLSERHGVPDRATDRWWGYDKDALYPNDFPGCPEPYQNFEADVGYGY